VFNIEKTFLYSTCLFMIFITGCSRKSIEPIQIKHYAVDSMEEIITESGTEIDKEITSDGNGSLRVSSSEPCTVKLYETGDIDIEEARLIYRAELRTDDVEGKVYLEMWCEFSGKGNFFSRALQSSLSGSNDWTSMETPFFLKKGENPENIRLNLVIDGKGTVWIDDIRLLKTPLK